MPWTNFSYLHPTTSPYTLRKTFLFLSPKNPSVTTSTPFQLIRNSDICFLFCSSAFSSPKFLYSNSDRKLFHEITLFEKSKCSKILLVGFR